MRIIRQLQTRRAATAHADDIDRDRGSALILVLVMMIICSLVVIPIMNYAMATGKANSVLSSKTRRLEAVKAGMRVALADPKATYTTCGSAGPTVARSLPGVTVNGVTVNTVCYYIDSQSALLDDQLRYGLVTTQVGETIPTSLKGNRFTAATTVDQWIALATRESETDKIWLPALPAQATVVRSAAGYEMPVPVATTQNPNPQPCRVYFPGTYRDPLTLDGNVYFTSGVYYFEQPINVVPGANVVVGGGPKLGCTFDQEAAFTAINGPSTHNITGQGGVWILGDKARLNVNNTPASGAEKPISLVFNRRYIVEAGTAKPRDVSILSVNGELDAGGNAVDLLEPGVIRVPLKLSATEANQSAALKPSLLTPKPKVPDAVGLDADPDPTATPRNGTIIVSWTAPTFNGGSKITGYTVTASVGATVAGTCTTTGATTCAITGLTNNTPLSVAVVATNAKGNSLPSAAISVTPTSGSGAVSAPTWPASNTPTVTAYRSSAKVAWVAPNLGSGNLPITSYTATAYAFPGATPAGSCTVDATTGATPAVRECYIDFSGALNVLGYTFSVVANNAVGPSPATSSSGATIVDVLLNALLQPRPANPTPPADPKYKPTPIIEFNLARTSSVTVEIPGYVAVPQGRVYVSNPNAHPITVVGGILAAQFDVTDKRGVDAGGNPVVNSVDFGFVEFVVQRKLKIVSTTAAGPAATSRAIVQINQTGAYAVNQWEVR